LTLVVYAVVVDRRYLASLLVLPLLLVVPAVRDRLVDLQQGTKYTGQMKSESDKLNSYAWRKVMWQSALADSEDDRLLGKGLGSSRINSKVFFPIPIDNPSGLTDVHSGFVQAIYETGILGFACYLFIYAAVLWRAWEGRLIDRRGSFMVISVILAHMMAAYSDNIFYYVPLNWYFWSFIGIVFAKWDLELLEIKAHSGVGGNLHIDGRNTGAGREGLGSRSIVKTGT
jgi:O-antigen ligase